MSKDNSKRILTGEEAFKYMNGESHLCPFCKSSNIETSDRDFQGDTIVNYVDCNACGGKWDDIFTLTSVEARNQ